MKFLKFVTVLALLPISLAIADDYIARGERGGDREEWNRGENRQGENRQGGQYSGQFNKEASGNYNRSGNTYNRNEQEYRNYNSGGYSGEYGNAGSAARGYARGYQSGENQGGGGGYATPVYVQPPAYSTPPQNTYNPEYAPNY